MAGDGDLDDAFAAFLNEVEAVEEAGPAQDAEPATKRARGSEPAEAAAAGPYVGAEGRAAEKLRKAAFLGDVASVQQVLGRLSAVDRLLIIDSPDDDDGYAPLHLAAIRGACAVASALLRGRADVDVASLSGDTPLMWAAHRGDAEMCRVLLRAGADASLKNDNGRTAGVQAKAAGKVRVSQLLQEHAFDVGNGLKRKAAAKVDAAAERRARNAALVAEMVRNHEEKKEEEAYWAKIRARAEGRKATDDARPAAPAGAGRFAKDAEDQERQEAARLLAALPAKVRPHFETLGAAADATEDDVRKLYRKLALKHHPDKNPKDPAGAKERFTLVAVAYEAVLEHLQQSEAPKGVCFAPPKF